MPRPGAEPKPTWQSFPLDIRQHVEERFGVRVIRARRAWDGYGSTPTFRLRKIQYQQLVVVLYWAAHRFSLTPSDWLLGMFD